MSPFLFMFLFDRVRRAGWLILAFVILVCGLLLLALYSQYLKNEPLNGFSGFLWLIILAICIFFGAVAVGYIN